MAFVSPFSLLLLMGYKNMLDRLGPGGALQQSTFLCAVTCLVSGIAIAVLQKTQLTVFGSIPVVKFLSGPLFIFRESYVQLLTSQYWSFMASALTPNQSAQWFGPIAGLTSIASAAAGFAVSPLVQRVGLSGVVCGTGLTLLLSMIGAKEAYAISDKYGFTPGKTSSSTKEKKKASSSSSLQQHKKSEDDGLFGLFQTAVKLFARVPVLGALFAEILASQGLATVLNVAFVARLGTAIPNDRERAGWVGIFFAVINLVTMVLQFSILPQIMKFIEPRDLWRVVPLVSCLSTTFQAFQNDPSLYAVSLSLLIMKVSEYSARRLLDEMVFVPLDFESRFVGKEVLGVFGYRFGKSLMSLVLSGITAIFGSCGLRELSVLSSMVSFAWLQTAWRVSLLVPTHLEAQEQHEKEKKNE
jgi:ATP/ADP translocase